MDELGCIDEADQVARWRLQSLLDAGYTIADAERIAARTDIDLHDAVELVGRGCQPRTAAKILL